MQEKFSLPVTTFLRQPAGNSSSLQCFCVVLICSKGAACSHGGLCCGTFITDQDSAWGAITQPACLLLLHLHTHSLAKMGKAFYKMQSENEETESELEFTEVNHQCKQIYQWSNWAFLCFWGDWGFFQLWVWVFFFLWFSVLFGGGDFTLLWVAFTARCSQHKRIILYASETTQPNCFSILFMLAIG